MLCLLALKRQPLFVALATRDDGFNECHAARAIIDGRKVQLQFGRLDAEQLGTHGVRGVQIDVAKRLDKRLRVAGRQARFGEERGDIFDHFGVTFDYPNGARGFHMSRQMANCSTDNSDFAYGTKGRLTAKPWAGVFIIEGENAWETDVPGNDMYQTEHDEMFASIRAGEPINDGHFMANSTMLSVMARLASYTGQTVSWEQAMASTERLGPEDYAFGDDVPELIVPIPGRTRLI